MGKYIVGITGASGSVYAQKLILNLLECGHEVHMTVTNAGKLVLKEELRLDITGDRDEDYITSYLRALFGGLGHLFYYDIHSIGAQIASGSSHADGMVVLPCSMATVSAIATGASRNLLERAADVMLKERRKLIIVPREAPFNSIHLQNMLTLSQNNAQIVPACPSFYHKPETLDDLVNYFIGRLLDQLGIRHNLISRWQGI